MNDIDYSDISNILIHAINLFNFLMLPLGSMALSQQIYMPQ